jgi:hypothetical protein
LTESFAASGYRNKQLCTLNRCRIQLHVVTLADITTGEGRSLLPGIFGGINPMRDASPYTYPQQGQLPPAGPWRLLEMALRKAIRVDNHRRLATPLGQWISMEGNDTWPSWYDPDTSFIYIRQPAQPAQIRRFRITRGFARGFRMHVAHGTVDQLTPTSVRASAWIGAEHHLQMTGWAQQLVPPAKPDPITLDEARTQLSADAQWAVEWIEQLSNTALLAEGLRTGRTIAAANGTFKEQRGASGFALVHEPTAQRINGANQVLGEETDQVAYRSELAGIYGTLLLS